MIVLIITVIVMLILVSVAVKTAIGNGLFTHTKKATQEWVDKESEDINLSRNLINKYGNETSPADLEEGTDTSQDDL